MNIEREEKMEVEQLKRIADAIEEILRIVKKDMEPREKNKKAESCKLQALKRTQFRNRIKNRKRGNIYEYG